MLPSSVNYGCDEGCDGAVSDLCYYSIAQIGVQVYSFVHEFWKFVTPSPSASLGQIGRKLATQNRLNKGEAVGLPLPMRLSHRHHSASLGQVHRGQRGELHRWGGRGRICP